MWNVANARPVKLSNIATTENGINERSENLTNDRMLSELSKSIIGIGRITDATRHSNLKLNDYTD